MPVIDEEKIAAAQKAFDEALAGNEAAHAALVSAKAKCEAVCPAAGEAVAGTQEGTDARETAVWTEEELHQEHREELEAAYAAVGRLAIAETNLRRAQKGFGPARDSNPAPAGEVTQLDAAIVVESGLIADPPEPEVPVATEE